MRINTTERENLMYEIIGRISAMDAPIIFKGALITKLVLAESNFSAISRGTVDIDANWTDEPPTTNQLVGCIKSALQSISSDLDARLIRGYGEKKSAGIEVFHKATGSPVVEIDISVGKSQASKLYHHGELMIKGVLPTEILADKISVLSSNRIFRRSKDLIDVYALVHCSEVNTNDIYESHKRNNRELGGFVEFSTRQADLAHAYEKLRGITNKPSFEDVHRYISIFLEPFILTHKANKIWLPQKSEWQDVPPIQVKNEV